MLLAHEWIASIGGSENVFRELIGMFPRADAICLWNDAPESFPEVGETAMGTSRLRGHKALALPLMPRAWGKVDLRPYESVLVSSHAFGHHLAGRAATEGKSAFSYVHTPARYVWAPEVEARGRGVAARLGSVPLRRVDRRAANAAVHYAANSHYIKDRVRRAWHVDADVIHPPIDVERITSVPRWREVLSDTEEQLFTKIPTGPFVLGASRLVAYKRLDQAIAVGEALDLPVVIAGSGPDEARLRSIAGDAGVPVVFAGRVSDAQLYALYQEAALFAFLPVEDFGIMPLEAIAAGTPALVNRVGGAREGVMAMKAGSEVDLEGGAGELAAAAHGAMSTDMSHARTEIGTFSRASFAESIKHWTGSHP